MYKFFFNNVLRRLDTETAHRLASTALQVLPIAAPIVRPLLKTPQQLRTRALGSTFASPFGLAAGFDKNAEEITGLGLLGFSHVEVGTLTKHAQPGNPRPRLFRLVADRALINRMGFNNAGSLAAVPRLERARLRKNRPVIGVNIGKSKITPVEDAVADYVYSTQLLAPLADYLAVNVSSPNTPGLRGLQELTMLEPLLTAVRDAAGKTPVLVKIAPDLDDAQIAGIVDLAARLGLSGIIATNTTISRDNLQTSAAAVAEMGAGGLSGVPLVERSLEVLRQIKASAPPELTIISVGGITTGADVLARLEAGADLVQGYTGFIYEGPLWAHRINKELAALGWHGNATAR
ncbi:quinone-dependent dihydroorotate dehydrogenase [Leucobacter sp. OH2974_COT-288]|nr:quinone-dependent dihydroorotate dehydrogenase [Leucobacter sp. OH2974_COT-288]